MNKFIIIWQSGQIRHVVSPNKEIALEHIPDEIKNKGFPDIPIVLSHPAYPVDYTNPNVEIYW